MQEPLDTYTKAALGMGEAEFVVRHPHPVLLIEPIAPEDVLYDGIAGTRTVVELRKDVGTEPDQPVAIGRPGYDSLSDVQIHARIMSRKHAWVRGEGGRWEILDARGRHGTFVNQARVGDDWVELADGAAVGFGAVVRARFYLPASFYAFLLSEDR